jgi:hypothetical protein
MSEELPFTSRVRIPKDVVFRDLEGEIVILNLKTGVYFGLDPVGTRIWHLLQEHGALPKVLDSLLNEYDATHAQCASDLFDFVARLRENELIEVSR